jgi:hypothetical protein
MTESRDGHSSCSCFSLSNPKGRDEGNLPMLLRRVATRIAELGPDAMILDLTLSSEVTGSGDWFSVTVYYAPAGWAGTAEDEP